MCGTAAAQTFTGGVRGAVRDANGVIPGVTVQLINEATAVVRETISNESGEYNFPAVAARHLHDQGRADRLQDLREHGPPHRDPAVPDARPRARGRHPAGDGHGHRRRAAHRDLERLDRRHARPRSARDPAGPRPQRLPHRRHGADGHDRRRSAVQPAAGSEQRLAGVARRRRHPGQQLPARRRADHRADRSRGAEPDDRGGRGSEGPGPHLRRRDGPDRRRRVQRDGAVRDQRVPRFGLLPDPPGVGRQRELLRREDRPVERGERTRRHLLPPLRRRHRRTDRQEPDVLLGRHRGLPLEHDPQRAADLAEPEAARRRLLDLDGRRRAGEHLQPVLPRRRRQRQVPGHRHRLAGHRRPVHRRHHPAHPPGGQPGRLRAARRLADRVDRRPDCRQREQPARTPPRPAPSSTRRTCSRSRPSTSSPTRGR